MFFLYPILFIKNRYQYICFNFTAVLIRRVSYLPTQVKRKNKCRVAKSFINNNHHVFSSESMYHMVNFSGLFISQLFRSFRTFILIQNLLLTFLVSIQFIRLSLQKLHNKQFQRPIPIALLDFVFAYTYIIFLLMGCFR